MSVYFIHLGRYVKVGFSDNPEQRFRKLFAGNTSYSAPWDCPRRLSERSLLGHVGGSKGDERIAHQILRDYGVGCEFYLAEPAVFTYVESCLAENRVFIPPIARTDGPAKFVGQTPGRSA